MSFLDFDHTSPTGENDSTFFDVPDTPMNDSTSSIFEDSLPFNTSDLDDSLPLFKTPTTMSPLTKKMRTQERTLTPKKNSGTGDSRSKTPQKVARSGVWALKTSQKLPESGAKISSLLGTSSSMMLTSASFETSVSVGNASTSSNASSDSSMDLDKSSSIMRDRKEGKTDDPTSSPIQKKTLNAVSSSSPPSSSGGLSAIIRKMMEVQSGHLMGSLRDLESHHRNGEEILDRARKIAQDVRDYEDKLVMTKTRCVDRTNQLVSILNPQETRQGDAKK